MCARWISAGVKYPNNCLTWANKKRQNKGFGGGSGASKGRLAKAWAAAKMECLAGINLGMIGHNCFVFLVEGGRGRGRGDGFYGVLEAIEDGGLQPGIGAGYVVKARGLVQSSHPYLL